MQLVHVVHVTQASFPVVSLLFVPLFVPLSDFDTPLFALASPDMSRYVRPKRAIGFPRNGSRRSVPTRTIVPA
jgi:hypothetical protein